MFFFRASNKKIREWFLDACIKYGMAGELTIHFVDDKIEYRAVNFDESVIPHVFEVDTRTYDGSTPTVGFRFTKVLMCNNSPRPRRKDIERDVKEFAANIGYCVSLKSKIERYKAYIDAGFNIGLKFWSDRFIDDGILISPRHIDKYVDFCADYAENNGWVKEKGIPFNKESMHKYLVQKMADEVQKNDNKPISANYPCIMVDPAYYFYNRIVMESKPLVDVSDTDEQIAPILNEIRECYNKGTADNNNKTI